MKIHPRLASVLLLLQLAACNRPPTCPDCEGEGEAEGEGEDLTTEEGVPPDLPCGGADLENDDLNCGSCGNACYVDWPGTKYAAGGCVDGECGPTWTEVGPLLPPPATQTCEQLCSFGDIPCVPRGCSGMTAFVCGTIGDFGDQCNLGNPDHYALVEFTGGCDEPIPYPENVDQYSFIDFACCCGP